MAVYLGNEEFETVLGKIDLQNIKDLLEDIKDFQEIQTVIKEVFGTYTEEDLKRKFDEGYNTGYEEAKK